MASLLKKGQRWHCQFVYAGRRRTFALGKVTEAEAEAKANQVDYLLMRLEQGYETLPSGVDIVTFVRADGKVREDAPAARESLALGALRDRYLDTNGPSLEATTLDGVRLHFKHIIGHLGDRLPVEQLSLEVLQGYVDKRSQARGTRGGRLSPATIKKEIITLRTAWNWALKMGLVSGRFPGEGLRHRKTDEKPPFQTLAEIRRQLPHASPDQKKDLWESLYLTKPEIDGVLEHARQHAAHPWIYPMICTAAHTGARRSELIRMIASDVDLEAGMLTVREMKRVRGKRSTRRVPLSPFLAGVLREWLLAHPGGRHLFCHAEQVGRSKKRSRTTGHRSQGDRSTTKAGRMADVRDRESPGVLPLTPDEAHHHLKMTLSGSAWAVLRGWHVLRHSFISLCASLGVDQRLIDDWVGHTTEEMRRRYRHLYPSVQREAIATVFQSS